MDIDSIVEQYKSRQINAQTALELLNANHLFAVAFMGLLTHLHDDQAAYEALSPTNKPSAPTGPTDPA